MSTAMAGFPNDYGPWLADLKARIAGARQRAAPAVPTGEIGQQAAARYAGNPRNSTIRS